MKERINLTLDPQSRDNLAAIADEWGFSLSKAMELLIANEMTRLGLGTGVRRSPNVSTIDVTFDRATLSEQATRLLEIAREQGVLVGDSSVTLWDNDELGLDDTLRVNVKSLLSFEDRARKFGIAGLDMSQVERGADGKPTYRVGVDGSPIPAEEYLMGLRKFYGEALDTGKTWEVPDDLVKAVRRGDFIGNAAIEAVAAEFWQWCEAGEFAPVVKE